jgi:2-oxoglutarate ferredoxin oxidoreductase subunit delta
MAARGKVVFDSERCKGCELCVNVCPVHIIELSKELNSKGYNYSQIKNGSDDKCIACGFCGMTCPDFVIKVEKL